MRARFGWQLIPWQCNDAKAERCEQRWASDMTWPSFTSLRNPVAACVRSRPSVIGGLQLGGAISPFLIGTRASCAPIHPQNSAFFSVACWLCSLLRNCSSLVFGDLGAEKSCRLGSCRRASLWHVVAGCRDRAIGRGLSHV